MSMSIIDRQTTGAEFFANQSAAPEESQPTSQEAQPAPELPAEQPAPEVAQPGTATPATAEEPKPAAAAPAVAQEPQDPYKALGLEGDEKFKKIVDAYKGNKLDEYLRIATADYDKLTTEELFRIDMQKKHPKFSKEQIDVLTQDKISREYGFEDDPNSAAFIRKEADADAIREGLKAEQANYEIPKYEPKETSQEPNTQTVKDFENFYNANPEVKEFETTGIVKLGSGDATFNYDTEKTMDLRAATFDPSNIYNSLYNEKGELNMHKWIRLATYAKNMDKVEAALIDHGRNLGKKQMVSELENAPATTSEAAKPKQATIKVVGR